MRRRTRRAAVEPPAASATAGERLPHDRQKGGGRGQASGTGGGHVVSSHLHQPRDFGLGGAEQRNTGEGVGQRLRPGEYGVVALGLVGALVGEDGLKLVVVEDAEGAGGDHRTTVASGQAVGGGFFVVENDDAASRVRPPDHVEDFAVLASGAADSHHRVPDAPGRTPEHR